MSKLGGSGSKRIGSMTSKGMGHCDGSFGSEQCGNGRWGIVKGGKNKMDKRGRFNQSKSKNIDE